MNKKVFKFRKIDYKRGMTLVELLVCLSIFVIVTGLTIFDYGSFRSGVSIQNLASDVSLAVRKAQSYAIGARKSTDFTRGFGVSFAVGSNNGNPLSGSSKSFIMFSDLDDSFSYDVPNQGSNNFCGNDNECNEVLNITGSDIISGISYYSSIYGEDTLLSQNESIDISFKRPNPDAYFCLRSGNGNCDNSSSGISSVKIIVSNGLQENESNYKSKSIIVSNTGQISVQ
jgi:prepilin-type N-terminal cleavage/methylation domain-containing protein